MDLTGRAEQPILPCFLTDITLPNGLPNIDFHARPPKGEFDSS